MRGWKGKLLRHPDGREGVCVRDSEGVGSRILYVVLEDETKHEIWLSNCGSTHESYRAWAWLYNRDTKAVLSRHEPGDEWIEFGE